MLISLLFVVALVAGAHHPPQAHGGDQQPRLQQVIPCPKIAVRSVVEQENADNAERYAYYKTHLKEYLRAGFAPANISNWILAALGLVGGVMAYDTLRTFKRQTDHMVNSERPWMVASIEREKIPQYDGLTMVGFSIRCRNVGKTPAFVVSMKHHGVILPRETDLPDERLPWEKFNVEEWPEPGIPLQPNDFLLRNNFTTWASNPPALRHGIDWLWVYGEIVYLDGQKNRHETRYCFLWDCVHDVEGVGKDTHFLIRGPASYIRAT